MSLPRPGEPRFGRRSFLKLAGAAAIGGASIALVANELANRSPNASGSERAPSPSGLTALGLAGSTPGPSASGPSPSPVGAGRRKFRTRPDLLPPIITVGTATGGTAPGFLFLTPGNGAGTDGPAIFDDAGELVWLRPDVGGLSAADFRVTQYGGRPVLTWWEGTVNGGIGTGEFVMADGSYKEISRIQAANGGKADLHELQITPSGTALFFADTGRPPTLPAGASPAPWQIMDCVVQEVDIATGRLLFEWHSADHVDLSESMIDPPTQGSQVYDYIHGNSIDLLPDGNLIVSARNTSAIYKVDRTTGDIVWRLGGKRSDFAMGAGTTFGWQHDARMQPDGTLTLFDDQAAPGKSRAIVLRLDETAKTASLVKAYARPVGILATSQGNMQVLPNGNILVGWGSQPYVSEFSPDGRLLYDATFPAAIQSYRDFRLPWVASPSDSPSIAVDPPTGGTVTVYASWNGATEIAGWDVLAGADAKTLSVVGSAARSGFETTIAVQTTQPLVAVRARDKAGKTLGTSPAVRTSG
jgi:Arylsulfotransferase (ASST)